MVLPVATVAFSYTAASVVGRQAVVPAQTDGNSPETGAPGQEEEGIEIPVQVRLGCPRPPVNSTQGAWGWGQAGSDSGCLLAAHGRSGNTELCAGGYKAALSMLTERSR